jgi:hypothetical protein
VHRQVRRNQLKHFPPAPPPPESSLLVRLWSAGVSTPLPPRPCSLEGLTPSEMDSLSDWERTFEAKYEVVGRVSWAGGVSGRGGKGRGGWYFLSRSEISELGCPVC